MNIVTEKRIPIDFKIGTDPEFVFVNGRYAISLCDILGLDKEDIIKSPLGPDGHAQISELRPTPSNEPLEVIGNMTSILKSYIKQYPDLLKYNWKAGSFVAGKFLGGHIHLGIHQKFIQPKTAATVFSDYVASLSLLLEDRATGIKRRVTPNWEGKFYGFKDEIRVKNIAHWEHRTMSSWLSSPYVSAAFLCLSKVVMYELLNNPFFKPDVDFPNAVFVNVRSDIVKNKFPHIWRQIKKMKLYPRYKKYIDVIKFLVDNDRNWFPSSSMKEAWGLVKPIPKVLPKPIEPIEEKDIWGNEFDKIVMKEKEEKSNDGPIFEPKDWVEFVKNLHKNNKGKNYKNIIDPKTFKFKGEKKVKPFYTDYIKYPKPFPNDE